MKKIFSIILAVMMISSFALISSAETFTGMKSVAVETEDGITVTVTLEGTITNFSGFMASFANNDNLTYVAASAAQGSDIANFENHLSEKGNGKTPAMTRWTASTADTGKYITLNDESIVLMTYKVERTAAAKDATLTAADFNYGTSLYKATLTSQSLSGTNSVNNSDNYLFEYVDNRTPSEPAKDEEFEAPVVTAPTETLTGLTNKDGEAVADIEMGANAKQIAVFGKNPASKDLAADKYGIKVGGKFYAGIAAVAKGQNWAIKLIAPNGIFKDGSDFVGAYEVEAYTVNDEGVKDFAAKTTATVE